MGEAGRSRPGGKGPRRARAILEAARGGDTTRWMRGHGPHACNSSMAPREAPVGGGELRPPGGQLALPSHNRPRRSRALARDSNARVASPLGPFRNPMRRPSTRRDRQLASHHAMPIGGPRDWRRGLRAWPWGGAKERGDVQGELDVCPTKCSHRPSRGPQFGANACVLNSLPRPRRGSGPQICEGDT
jgi:hypothetical protein